MTTRRTKSTKNRKRRKKKYTILLRNESHREAEAEAGNHRLHGNRPLVERVNTTRRTNTITVRVDRRVEVGLEEGRIREGEEVLLGAGRMVVGLLLSPPEDSNRLRLLGA